MTKPGERWPGFAALPPESDRHKQIKHLFSSANFEHMKQRAINSRRRREVDLPEDIDCSINQTQFATGFHNFVLELMFSDHVYWIAHIPHGTIDDKTKTSLLSEIGTMKIVRQRTNIPVPFVFDFDFETSIDKSFGYPYVLMEYLGGHQLNTGLADAIPQQYHARVAKQFAKVFAELQTLTFSRIGRLWCGDTADQPVEIIPMEWHYSPGPLDTSLEYFHNQRQEENRETIALFPNSPDHLTACWVLKTALAHVVVEDRVRGPFPLCHLDLHFGNLLFDDDYNLTGVIDWSHAQAAPIEQLSVCPEFVIFPGRCEEKNRPIVDFRNLVIQSVKEMEDEKAKEADGAEGEAPILDQQQGNWKPCPRLTPLSTYMASPSAELMIRQYLASPRKSLWSGRRVAKLIYGEHITWEQLREVYGQMPHL